MREPQWLYRRVRVTRRGKPIGVSTYWVTRELPESLQAEVPSIEDLQDVVEKLRPEMQQGKGAAFSPESDQS
jgi:hypothetical protein